MAISIVHTSIVIATIENTKIIETTLKVTVENAHIPSKLRQVIPFYKLMLKHALSFHILDYRCRSCMLVAFLLCGFSSSIIPNRNCKQIHQIPSYYHHKHSYTSPLQMTESTIDMLDTSIESIIESLVSKRSECRRLREYSQADVLKTELELEYQVELKDFSFKEGGHTTWRFKRKVETDDLSPLDDSPLMDDIKRLYAMTDTSSQTSACLHSIRRKLQQCIDEFEMDLSSTEKPLADREMLGRKFADAALLLALAGVEDPDLFELLTRGCEHELRRIGLRSSCRALDILQMTERLAASGIRDQSIFHLAADILQTKGNVCRDMSISALRSGHFSLFELRPLKLLYNVSSKQHKCNIFLSNNLSLLLYVH
jgi:hypothetical protein